MNAKVTILIVDDLQENLIALENLLDDPALHVLTARSGNEALQCMLDADVALVLLDVQMPGMDGYETAELMRLNPQTRGTPIIFVTATSGERQHIFRGYESGAVDYITKPIEPLILRSKVQVFCQLWRQREELEVSRRDLADAYRSLEEKNRDLEKDLDLARNVQLGFLPALFPREDRIRFAHAYEICTTLGGDLFDVYLIDEERIGLYVADVSGHGVNAALISGLLKMAMENLKARAEVDPAAMNHLLDPAHTLSELDASLRGIVPEETFITMIAGVIHLTRRDVTLASAGHPYPLHHVQADQRTDCITIENGPAISLGASAAFRNLTLPLAPRDTLLLYTDGLFEAMNRHGEEFGEDNFRASMAAHAHLSLEDMIKNILVDVKNHRGEEPISDDCTMVAFRLDDQPPKPPA
jgi:phosphoserine phosphatase RsbU/P